MQAQTKVILRGNLARIPILVLYTSWLNKLKQCQLTAMKHTYQLLTHAHNHITRAVAAMNSCFALVGAHQHGIAVGSMSRVNPRIRDPLRYWPYRRVGGCAPMLSIGIVSNLFGHTDQFSDPISIRMPWENCL